MITHHRLLVSISLILSCLWLPANANALEFNFFRIGTGGIGGTYYPIGGILALGVSNPPGSRACEQGGSCGVDNLIAFPQTSNGSVDNVLAIEQKRLESGLAQSDIVHWATAGHGIFKDTPKLRNIRLIANLFQESVHLVVADQSGIGSINDLVGKRVSLDEEGSGTLVDSLLTLKAFGIDQNQFKAHFLKHDQAIQWLSQGKLDAFFIVAGYPVESLARQFSKVKPRIIPITGPQVDTLVRQNTFLQRDRIPANTYGDHPAIDTIGVGAQWVVGAHVNRNLVYQITRALWHKNTRRLLDHGHDKGQKIIISEALKGLGTNLHPGAADYYREIGMLND